METFASRLKKALELKNMTSAELSRLTGIDEGTISNYRKGKYEPKQIKTEMIAKALNVSIPWLMGLDVPISGRKDNSTTIPVLGYVRAGIPITAVENIIDYEEISEETAKSGEYFALQIKGDSMEPRIREGDVVIVKKQEQVENGEIAVVLINGDEATVKKFYKTDSGIKLVSTNPAYDPFFFTNEEIKTLPLQIIGKVVELRAKF